MNIYNTSCPAMCLPFNLTEAECFGGSFTIQSLKKKRGQVKFVHHPCTKWTIERRYDLSNKHQKLDWRFFVSKLQLKGAHMAFTCDPKIYFLNPPLPSVWKRKSYELSFAKRRGSVFNVSLSLLPTFRPYIFINAYNPPISLSMLPWLKNILFFMNLYRISCDGH